MNPKYSIGQRCREHRYGGKITFGTAWFIDKDSIIIKWDEATNNVVDYFLKSYLSQQECRITFSYPMR